MLRLASSLVALVAALLPAGTHAGDLTCAQTRITVRSPDIAIRERTCRAVSNALPKLSHCGAAPERHQLIEMVASISDAPTCMGIYHCGEDRIELLNPDEMAAARKPDGPFSTLPDGVFFDSVVAHELAHAAYDAVPCPFENCLLTSEYVAYAMQIYSLSAADRATFEADKDTETRISRDAISLIGLMMAPGRFAAKVWAHFSQRDDGCAFVRQMMEGRVYLDKERP